MLQSVPAMILIVCRIVETNASFFENLGKGFSDQPENNCTRMKNSRISTGNSSRSNVSVQDKSTKLSIKKAAIKKGFRTEENLLCLFYL